MAYFWSQSHISAVNWGAGAPSKIFAIFETFRYWPLSVVASHSRCKDVLSTHAVACNACRGVPLGSVLGPPLCNASRWQPHEIDQSRKVLTGNDF